MPGAAVSRRYDVQRPIGEGAFAHVYRAHDVQGGRDVALKVLKDPYLTVKDVVERFQREVFAVASISSPHVVALYDFGISDDPRAHSASALPDGFQRIDQRRT